MRLSLSSILSFRLANSLSLSLINYRATFNSLSRPVTWLFEAFSLLLTSALIDFRSLIYELDIYFKSFKSCLVFSSSAYTPLIACNAVLKSFNSISKSRTRSASFYKVSISALTVFNSIISSIITAFPYWSNALFSALTISSSLLSTLVYSMSLCVALRAVFKLSPRSLIATCSYCNCFFTSASSPSSHSTYSAFYRWLSAAALATSSSA